MEREEVLKKVQSKKAIIGEMEYSKINKSNWIAVIVTCILAIVLMIIFGCLKNKMAIFAIATLCYTWATTFYFCQYFIAKRKHWGILLGAILELIGALSMFLCFIFSVVGVL